MSRARRGGLTATFGYKAVVEQVRAAVDRTLEQGGGSEHDHDVVKQRLDSAGIGHLAAVVLAHRGWQQVRLTAREWHRDQAAASARIRSAME